LTRSAGTHGIYHAVAKTPESKQENPAKMDGAQLADIAGDPERQARLAAAIEKLTPAEAQKVLEILEREMTKRSRQLYGYIASGIALIVGMIGVLVYWGSVPEGTSVAWTIPIPFLFVAIMLMIFGRWSNRA
jgi:hypothetical protein